MQVAIPDSEPPHSPAQLATDPAPPSPVNTDSGVDPEFPITFQHKFRVRSTTNPSGWELKAGSQQIWWSIDHTEPEELPRHCTEIAENNGESIMMEIQEASNNPANEPVDGFWTLWVLDSTQFRKGRAMRCFFPPGFEGTSKKVYNDWLAEAHGRGVNKSAGICFETKIEQVVEEIHSPN